MSSHKHRHPASFGLPRRPARLSREAIISAAAASFYAHGYAETSLSTVARQLSVTDKAIYYYFDSKDDLFLEAVNRCMDWVVSIIQAIDRSPASGLDKIKAFARAVVRQSAGRPPNLRDLPEHLENTELGQRYRALERAQEEIITGWVSQGIADGSIRPDNPKVLWVWNQGALIWLDAWARRFCSNYSPELLEAAVMNMLDRSLAAIPDRRDAS